MNVLAISIAQVAMVLLIRFNDNRIIRITGSWFQQRNVRFMTSLGLDCFHPFCMQLAWLMLNVRQYGWKIWTLVRGSNL